MPRDIPLGNGSLLVNFDHTGQIRDIYWPHVGQENHTSGHVSRIGVWVDGSFSWLDDASWQRELGYLDDTLVSRIMLLNEHLHLRLEFTDGVDFHEDLLVRRCTVENLLDRARRLVLYFCQDFSISGTVVGDSAYYEPEHGCLYHYKGRRWFRIALVKGRQDQWAGCMDQWAVGIKDGRQLEGAWRDAEDGRLSGNPVAQGRVDSVAGSELQLSAHGQETVWYMLSVGVDFAAVNSHCDAAVRKGPVALLDRTAAYWRLWVNKDRDPLPLLPPRFSACYNRSLLILRTQIDNDGAILAANDYDIAQFNRDTYSYMWPRDGALVASALVDAGYSEITRRFFDFCHRVITDEGYLLHKYTPDGALASSWHAWYVAGEKRLPIQEDETALVLWALWRHFHRFRDIEYIKHHYRGLVIRAAEWMCSYIEEDSGLPLASWDLWEERFGVHAWTVGSVWAGLTAAADFAEAFGEDSHALRYRRTAAAIKQAFELHFWDAERGVFLRSILHREDGCRPDTVMDASLVGLWMFGMYSPDDEKIVSTMTAMEERLWVRTEVGGLARYENDYYHQVSSDISRVPGNPWFICTLWLAQWRMLIADSGVALARGRELLSWAVERTLPSGVMAEQVNPENNAPLSVSPLTWSHATYVAACRTYLDQADRLTPL